ncbi:basic salivary proline-rich protein 2-like [Dendropsophus ebraccatus]|uniref:basic salivary proline-rich protein 2-like n=1 Tax=Dendropsophus ebraccatus TaxID=150705 RepID=UPI00383178F8
MKRLIVLALVVQALAGVSGQPEILPPPGGQLGVQPPQPPSTDIGNQAEHQNVTGPPPHDDSSRPPHPEGPPPPEDSSRPAHPEGENGHPRRRRQVRRPPNGQGQGGRRNGGQFEHSNDQQTESHPHENSSSETHSDKFNGHRRNHGQGEVSGPPRPPRPPGPPDHPEDSSDDHETPQSQVSEAPPTSGNAPSSDGPEQPPAESVTPGNPKQDPTEAPVEENKAAIVTEANPPNQTA